MTIAYGALRPGIGTAREATHRTIFLNNSECWLPGGKTINGSASRDPGNTPVGVLRPGLLMGKITATGLYAPSIVGVITEAYTSGGTELTVSVAQATELDRLVGQAGTAELVAIGPPTAAGTVAVTDITHSAIVTATGVITVSSLGVDKIAGTLIAVKDGRQLPRTFIGDREYGIQVVDQDGTSVAAVDFPKVPTAGQIDASQLINWPSDTSLQTWIIGQINGDGGGFFVFDNRY